MSAKLINVMSIPSSGLLSGLTGRCSARKVVLSMRAMMARACSKLSSTSKTHPRGRRLPSSAASRFPRRGARHGSAITAHQTAGAYSTARRSASRPQS
eukprot:2051954-Prymnesium_polylepis.1